MKDLWTDTLAKSERDGFRNSQVTVLAPTGTISFLMDCDTTGIEPDIALVKYKNLAGGGTLKMVNRTVSIALDGLGYRGEKKQAILDHIEKTGSAENAPGLDSAVPVFDCALAAPGSGRFIHWQGHVKMMAAAQPFISGAISKTVNLPNDITPETVAEVYQTAWKLGLKGIAIYRDGSKAAQPLSTEDKIAVSLEFFRRATRKPPGLRRQPGEGAERAKGRQDKASKERKTRSRLHREKLPDTRTSVTHKFTVAGYEGYLTVGLYPDDKPGELFVTMSKNGSTIGGLMDSFVTAVSLGLQYGVPLRVFIDKFEFTRFEPQGMTRNPDIPIAKSLIDYIFRWLKIALLRRRE